MRFVASVLGGLALGIGAVMLFRDRSPRSLLLVGDSLVGGLGPAMKPLASSAGIPLQYVSKSGARVDQWAGSWLAEALAAHPSDAVMVSLGTNDSYGNIPAADQRQAIANITSQIRASGARAIWLLPPVMPFDVTPFYNLVRQIVPSSDIHTALPLVIARGDDKIHPTGQGYQEWVYDIWKQFEA